MLTALADLAGINLPKRIENLIAQEAALGEAVREAIRRREEAEKSLQKAVAEQPGTAGRRGYARR